MFCCVSKLTRYSMRLLWPRLMQYIFFLRNFVYFRCALTPVTKPPRVCSQLDRGDRDGSGRLRELRDCWAESFCLRGKMTEQSTKLKLYVAFVKLNLAITEAARLEVITLMQSSPRLDGPQPTLHDFSRKIARPIREKVAIWVAGDCRPINVVEDSGLIEVIRIASGEILTIYRRGAPLCLKKKIQLNNSVPNTRCMK